MVFKLLVINCFVREGRDLEILALLQIWLYLVFVSIHRCHVFFIKVKFKGLINKRKLTTGGFNIKLLGVLVCMKYYSTQKPTSRHYIRLKLYS